MLRTDPAFRLGLLVRLPSVITVPVIVAAIAMVLDPRTLFSMEGAGPAFWRGLILASICCWWANGGFVLGAEHHRYARTNKHRINECFHIFNFELLTLGHAPKVVEQWSFFGFFSRQLESQSIHGSEQVVTVIAAPKDAKVQLEIEKKRAIQANRRGEAVEPPLQTGNAQLRRVQTRRIRVLALRHAAGQT